MAQQYDDGAKLVKDIVKVNTSFQVPSYPTASLPTPVTGKYEFAYDTTAGAFVGSDGSSWASIEGTLAAPASLDDLSDVVVSTPADGHVLVYDTTTFNNVAISGDLTLSKLGVAAIASGVIVNADVNASAAIAWSKMAALTSAHLLVGSAGNVATDVALSGDGALSNAGVLTVTDLTITGETSGDVLTFDGVNWVHAAQSTLLSSKLAQTAGIEAGTYDVVLSTTTQTTSAPTLTIPDFAGVSDTFAFVTKAATFVNKTYDANGTGNVLSNVGPENLQAGATASVTEYAPFVIQKDVSNSATVSIYTANCPYKLQILDAWVVNKSAGNSGTWKLDNGTNDITTAVNYTGSDTALVHAASLDDAYWTLNANATLRCINSVATDDAYLYILAIRVT